MCPIGLGGPRQGTLVSNKRHLSWDEVSEICESLAVHLQKYDFDAVLGIARGGLVPTAIIANQLGLHEVLNASIASYDGDSRQSELKFLSFPPDTVLAGRRILLVDDIWDSGRTARFTQMRLKAAGAHATLVVLHYKPQSSAFGDESPDLYHESTEEWIVYPWESYEGDAQF